MGTTQADKLHYITHFNFISFNFLVLFLRFTKADHKRSKYDC